MDLFKKIYKIDKLVYIHDRENQKTAELEDEIFVLMLLQSK